MTESRIQVGMSDAYLRTKELSLEDGTKAHDEYVRIAAFPDGPHFDAFSRLRVSNPTTLFDSQSQYDDGTAGLWFHKATGASTTSHDHNQACITLTTTAGATDALTRQTQRYIRYQPGKSQLIFVTFDMKANDGGTKEVFYGDEENGIGFRNVNGALSFVRLSKRTGSVVETVIAQEDWDGDVFDGSGAFNNPSGETLDETKAQIMIIDLQWLAVGRVRIGFDINGAICYGHHFEWANLDSGVYMSTANLPIRYTLTGNGNVSSMDCICASVMSEGGFVSDLGIQHSTPNGVAGISCAVSTQTPVISIRPAALFKTYTNRGEYILSGITFYVSGSAVLLSMYRGAALTGASFASSGTESGIEYDTSATAASGGYLLGSEFGAAASGGKAFQTAGAAEATNKVYLTLDIDGAIHDGGNITLVGEGIGGTATVYANLHWTEIK